MDYRQYLNFDEFKQYILNVNHEENNRNDYNPNRRDITDDFMKNHTEHFMAFLAQARSEHHLGEIEHSETHNSNFVHIWNKFLNEPESLNQYDKHHVLNTLMQPLLFEANYYREDEKITDESLVQRYEHLIERLNTGAFTDDSPLSSITLTEHYCFECGAKMKLFFNHWHPELKVFGKFDGKYEYRCPEPCIGEKLHTLSLEVKGTELLAADWFRIPAFTEAVDTHYEFDINCAKGQLDEAKYLLEKFNVAKISMGNMVPHMFMKGDLVVAGYEDEEAQTPHDFTDLGRVCCDLWAITLLEADTLVKIVAEKQNISEADARLMVDKYLDETDYIVRIPVQPGQYDIRIANNYQDFKKKAREDDSIAWDTDGIEPFFIIQKALPKKEHKLKM